MYEGLTHLHNFLRWVILLLLIVAVIKHLSGMSSGKAYTSGDRKVGLFLMIAAHIQLLIGLYQWFAGNFGLKLIQAQGMGEVMGNSASRFWVVEHTIGMLVAIILITLGKGVAKKNISDNAKHTKAFWNFLIALILILAVIPWPFRDVARPLFPGMSI